MVSVVMFSTDPNTQNLRAEPQKMQNIKKVLPFYI